LSNLIFCHRYLAEGSAPSKVSLLYLWPVCYAKLSFCWLSVNQLAALLRRSTNFKRNVWFNLILAANSLHLRELKFLLRFNHVHAHSPVKICFSEPLIGSNLVVCLNTSSNKARRIAVVCQKATHCCHISFSKCGWQASLIQHLDVILEVGHHKPVFERSFFHFNRAVLYHARHLETLSSHRRVLSKVTGCNRLGRFSLFAGLKERANS